MAVQTGRFLVVEDSAADAELIENALSAIPRCSASICRNAAEVKAYLSGAGIYEDRERYPLPSVILLDLHVGPDSGLDLLRWIRASPPAIGNIAVIILTGAATQPEWQAAVHGQAQRVYRKPDKWEDLRYLLAEVAAEFCPEPNG